MRVTDQVWDPRAYRNLDDSVELGTRNIKVALRRLRTFAREGAPDEFDLENTINSTAKTMSPYEILQPGGSAEYFNQEPGAAWVKRVTDVYAKCAWLNMRPFIRSFMMP